MCLSPWCLGHLESSTAAIHYSPVTDSQHRKCWTVLAKYWSLWWPPNVRIQLYKNKSTLPIDHWQLWFSKLSGGQLLIHLTCSLLVLRSIDSIIRILCTTDSKVFEKSITLTEYPINQSSKQSSEIILSSSSVKDAYFLGVLSVIPLEMKKAGNTPHHQIEGSHSPHFQMQGQKYLLNFSVLFASWIYCHFPSTVFCGHLHGRNLPNILHHPTSICPLS